MLRELCAPGPPRKRGVTHFVSQRLLTAAKRMGIGPPRFLAAQMDRWPSG